MSLTRPRGVSEAGFWDDVMSGTTVGLCPQTVGIPRGCELLRFLRDGPMSCGGACKQGHRPGPKVFHLFRQKVFPLKLLLLKIWSGPG